ncbi:hypothetical protein [Novosphingobium panipatense]|uniref:hypothetical protein n=1 Tax=Novosphingobium panipatense TaxID=428991 RepID=UPI003610E6BD
MRAAVLLIPALLSACDLSMADQPRADDQEMATLWPGGPPRQAMPMGTVALDEPARDDALRHPPALTAALLDRGQERYAIYCSVCHGARGEGDGPVVRRGFPPPPLIRTRD